MARTIIIGNGHESKSGQANTAQKSLKQDPNRHVNAIGIAAAIVILLAITLIFRTVRGIVSGGDQNVALLAANQGQGSLPPKGQAMKDILAGQGEAAGSPGVMGR